MIDCITFFPSIFVTADLLQFIIESPEFEKVLLELINNCNAFAIPYPYAKFGKLPVC